MITVESLCKTFKVAKRNAGFKEAFKSLFLREFEDFHALKDVSFTIDEGEIVGYIGPNGAGKSTTIKIMSGVLRPDSGKCTILGRIPWEDRINHVKNIGVVFGQRSQLWWDVPVIDSFQLLKDIYKMSHQEYSKSYTLLVEILDLGEIINKPVRQLSLGQRIRCEIAASLIHNPKILFLDEPTIGLDAASKIAVRKFIKLINKEKKTTIILTTHDMHDIDALAQRILLIGKGQILCDGKLEELKNKFSSNKTITIDYQENQNPLETDGATIISWNSERASFLLNTKTTSVSDIISKLSKKVDIIDMTIESSPIEEIIVQLYKEYSV